jgi:HK97 family phage major capsid protein
MNRKRSDPMTLEELRAKLDQVVADQVAICDQADANEENPGAFTAEQQEEYDRLEALHGQYTATIQRREAAQARIDAHAAGQVSAGRAAQAGAPLIPLANPAGTNQVGDTLADPWAGFTDAAEFGVAVRAAFGPGGTVDERLTAIMAAPANYMTESGGTEGYLVPPQMRQDIWSLVWGQEDLLSQIDSEPTTSNQVGYLKDETTPWGSTGVTAKWRNEGSQMVAEEVPFETAFMALHELYSFVLATDELLEDAPRLANRLTVKAAEAINHKITGAIVEGTGAGQPEGYLTSESKVEVAKEGSQAADTVVAANVAKMFSRMLPQGHINALWMVAPSVLPQLMLMTIGDQPIWTPPTQGFTQAPGGFLMGRPIVISQYCETLGDANDIHYINPKGYYGATKAGGPKFDTSIHLFFDYGVNAFRWTFRFGGQSHMSAAVTPNKDTANTLSNFITLAERA